MTEWIVGDKIKLFNLFLQTIFTGNYYINISFK
jgi:hypothetical protein